MNTSNKFHFTIEIQDVGKRIDKWLCEKSELSDSVPTRSFAQNLIEKSAVLVNQKTTKSSYQLRLNDSIEITKPELKPSELIPYDFPLDITYEDDDLLVINKPSGLVIHPAAGHEQDTLVNALLNYTKNLSMKNEQRPGIVHRIDKETSGLLVIAKNDFTHDHLSQQFKNKTSHRVYYALTDRHPENPIGTIQSYLARHPTDRKRYASLKENNKIIDTYRGDLSIGKWAVTRFEYLESKKDMSLLKIKLETGRTHQIRIHMSEMRCPLVGDLMYGFSVKKMKELKIDRFFLHAAELGFIHPKTGKSLMFKVDWPLQDLNRMLNWGFKKYV